MRRGLSLIEAIVAMFILLLVLIFVSNLFPSALTAVRVAGQKSQADALAGGLLAEWQARPFSELAVGAPVTRPPQDGFGTRFDSQIEFFPVTEPKIRAERMRKLRATVTWTDRGRTYQLVREVWRTDVRK